MTIQHVLLRALCDHLHLTFGLPYHLQRNDTKAPASYEACSAVLMTKVKDDAIGGKIILLYLVPYHWYYCEGLSVVTIVIMQQVRQT